MPVARGRAGGAGTLRGQQRQGFPHADKHQRPAGREREPLEHFARLHDGRRAGGHQQRAPHEPAPDAPRWILHDTPESRQRVGERDPVEHGEGRSRGHEPDEGERQRPAPDARGERHPHAGDRLAAHRVGATRLQRPSRDGPQHEQHHAGGDKVHRRVQQRTAAVARQRESRNDEQACRSRAGRRRVRRADGTFGARRRWPSGPIRLQDRRSPLRTRGGIFSARAGFACASALRNKTPRSGIDSAILLLPSLRTASIADRMLTWMARWNGWDETVAVATWPRRA